MADISMCSDAACPLRQRCFRYRAFPNKQLQTYGAFKHRSGDVPGCSEFWDVQDRKDIRKMDDISGENVRIKEAIEL